MHTQITQWAAQLAVGGVVIAGGATTIPLAPVLIGVGLVAGTVVAVSHISNSTKVKLAKLQTRGGDNKLYVQLIFPRKRGHVGVRG